MTSFERTPWTIEGWDYSVAHSSNRKSAPDLPVGAIIYDQDLRGTDFHPVIDTQNLGAFLDTIGMDEETRSDLVIELSHHSPSPEDYTLISRRQKTLGRFEPDRNRATVYIRPFTLSYTSFKRKANMVDSSAFQSVSYSAFSYNHSLSDQDTKETEVWLKDQMQSRANETMQHELFHAKQLQEGMDFNATKGQKVAEVLKKPSVHLASVILAVEEWLRYHDNEQIAYYLPLYLPLLVLITSLVIKATADAMTTAQYRRSPLEKDVQRRLSQLGKNEHSELIKFFPMSEVETDLDSA
jgi:hypothetical protein